MCKLFGIIVYLFIITDTLCQQLPIKAARTISFTTDEGSYMNIDVSPDGKKIVFDMLGDLFTLPITGGKATQLTSGLALNLRPVWSPDNKRIAYLSDGSGSFHLNVREVAGVFTKTLGQSDEALYYGRNAIWMPDGKSIAVRNMVYSITDNKTLPSNLGDPIRFSKDGKRAYHLNANKLYSYDYTTRNRQLITSVAKDFQYGDISPNGRWWAYIKDSNSRQCLMAKDLNNNIEKMIVPSLFMTPKYKPAIPPMHFSFSPDSKYLFIGYAGKIHRIELLSSDDKIIPFLAHVQSSLGPLNYNKFRINHNRIKVNYIRSANTSPDGKQLIFSALNKIYRMKLPRDKVDLLVDQPFSQYQPVYSPDGHWIAYVSWCDTTGGHLWQVSATGGRPKRLSAIPGLYQHPAWSPDGKFIAVVAGVPKFGDRDFPGIGKLILIPVNGDSVRTIDEEVPLWNQLVFSRDGRRIIYQPWTTRESNIPILVSKNIDGGDSQVVTTGNNNIFIQQRSLSPDGSFIVYSWAEDLYLIPLVKPPPVVNAKTQQIPIIRFASGVDPYWEKGGNVLCWTYGNQFYRVDTDKILATVKNHAQKSESLGSVGVNDIITAPVIPDQVVKLDVSAPASFAKGTIALRNVRIITMQQKKIIENGTIVIRNGRIIALGPKTTVAIPKDAKLLNLTGATIMPGLVDLHMHMRIPPEIFPQQSWMFLSSLAYGITTARDPSLSFDSYGYKELLETGQMIGPRLFTVGRAVNPVMLMKFDDLQEAQAIVHKRAVLGGTVVKQYQLPTRLQRQWLLMACRQARLNMTNEGSPSPILEIAMLKDGSTGVEHNPIWGDVYKDIISCVVGSQSWLTPTLQEAYGTVSARDYFNYTWWRQADKKMIHFIDSSTGALQAILNAQPTDTLHPGFLAPAFIDARILHAGGRIGMGSHGNDKGVGPHNEIWALQMGGLTNYEALRAATLTGAEALGVQQDLGSIEVGKIADLLILNKNPLDDIHNTREIRYVMKDGILYDGDTLDEIWPEVKKCPEWKLKVPVKQP